MQRGPEIDSPSVGLHQALPPREAIIDCAMHQYLQQRKEARPFLPGGLLDGLVYVPIGTVWQQIDSFNESITNSRSVDGEPITPYSIQRRFCQGDRRPSPPV